MAKLETHEIQILSPGPFSLVFCDVSFVSKMQAGTTTDRVSTQKTRAGLENDPHSLPFSRATQLAAVVCIFHRVPLTERPTDI